MKVATWNIRCLNKISKQKEVIDFILEKELSMCAILETHLKGNKVANVANKIFSNWHWVSNNDQCERGCRILLGWDSSILRVMVLTSNSI